MIDSNLVEKQCRENGDFRTEYDQILTLVNPTFNFSSPNHNIIGQAVIKDDILKDVFHNEDFQKILEEKMPPSLFITIQRNPSTCWEISDNEDSAVFWRTVKETINSYPRDTFKSVSHPQENQTELDDRLYGPVFENEGAGWRADEFNPERDKDESTQSELMRKLSRAWQIYRQRQDTLWDSSCAVTGISTTALLRSSPAMKWHECETGAERLDPYNGFLLSVGLDALFSADLISFTPTGDIMVSPLLSAEDMAAAGITDLMYLRRIFPRNLRYLSVQRDRFLLNCGKAGVEMRDEVNNTKNRYTVTLFHESQSVTIPTSCRFIRSSEQMEIVLTEYLAGLWLKMPPEERKAINDKTCAHLSLFTEGLIWFDEVSCETDNKDKAFELMSNTIGKIYNIIEPLLNCVEYPFRSTRIEEESELPDRSWSDVIMSLLPAQKSLEPGFYVSQLNDAPPSPENRLHMQIGKQQIADRIKGCLFGEAIGDALGLGTEFMTPDEAHEAYPDGLQSYDQFVNDRHRSIWLPGEWTDDTDMTLCIVDAMIQDENILPMTVAKNFRRWLDGKPRGCGKHTALVLGLGDYLDNPIQVSKDIWEASGNKSAPNGALMRNCAIGLWNQDVEKNAETICKLTHFDPRCVGSCVIHALLINHLIWHDEELPLATLTQMADQYDPRIREFILHGYRGLKYLKLGEVQSIGYTLKSLGAAIWSFYHAEDFEQGLLSVVNEAGDADTNGAIACSLLGAKFGYSAIPQQYVKGLISLDALNDKVNCLTDLLLRKFF